MLREQNNNTRAQCQTIVYIPLALMKQFNLHVFPVTRGIVAIIQRQYILYTHWQRSNTYTLKKTKKQYL